MIQLVGHEIVVWFMYLSETRNVCRVDQPSWTKWTELDVLNKIVGSSSIVDGDVVEAELYSIWGEQVALGTRTAGDNTVWGSGDQQHTTLFWQKEIDAM